MNNKELVEYLNNLKILQISCWEECIPEDIWNKYFKDKHTIKEESLNIDKHRWYELSTEVIKINNGFIGVRYISNLYSEQSSYEDMYHTLKFFEMEEVPSVTYKNK